MMRTTTINCTRYTADERCSIGLANGRPPWPFCARCNARSPKEAGLGSVACTIVDRSPPAAGDASGVYLTLWREFHLRPLTIGTVDAMAWLDSFYARLPCTWCGEGFKGECEAQPPPLATSRAFFNWTVDRHNDVNARLAKPRMRHDAAFEHWSAVTR